MCQAPLWGLEMAIFSLCLPIVFLPYVSVPVSEVPHVIRTPGILEQGPSP